MAVVRRAKIRPTLPRSRRVVSGLSPRDFRDYLLHRAALMAPADVEVLVDEAIPLRRRAVSDGTDRPTFRRQVELALDLLTDHVRDRCPQIPYHTVSLLAAALFYYRDPMDVIPDFVPKVGLGDDALMMAFACKEAAAGIERYRVARESPTPRRRTRK